DRVVCFVLLSAERLAILRVVVNAGVSRILGIRSALHCAWGPSGRAARRADLCTTPSCRGAPGSVTGRSPRRTFPVAAHILAMLHRQGAVLEPWGEGVDRLRLARVAVVRRQCVAEDDRSAGRDRKEPVALAGGEGRSSRDGKNRGQGERPDRTGGDVAHDKSPLQSLAASAPPPSMKAVCSPETNSACSSADAGPASWCERQ